MIVTDVYSASEDPIDGISGKNFAEEIKAENYTGNIENVSRQLFPTLKSGDIVIGLGAGTITTLGKFLEEASIANRV